MQHGRSGKKPKFPVQQYCPVYLLFRNSLFWKLYSKNGLCFSSGEEYDTSQFKIALEASWKGHFLNNEQLNAIFPTMNKETQVTEDVRL